MHLDQHRQPQSPGHLEQIGQILVGEDRRDQQGGIGPGGPGLEQLVGGEDEVLAQQGELHRVAHRHQHLKAPLEEALVGQHRQAAGATIPVAPGNGDGVEVFADHPLAGAGLLDLGDHSRFAAAGPQGCREVPGGGQLGHLLLERFQADPFPGGRHFPVLLPDDLLEDVAGALLGVGGAEFQVGHPDRGVGGPATDLHLRHPPP